MVTFNLAYTAPINKAGVTPVLTQAQVWEGLKIKVKRANEFVSAITECQVLSEETLPTGQLQVTRQARLAPDVAHAGNLIKERCVHHAPCRVDFYQEDNTVVTNAISNGPDGELLMSYIFEWYHNDVSEGSEKAAQVKEAHWKMAKVAVESSIDTIRRMVIEGKIK